MECGDVVYRSTLPRQGFQITAPGVALTVLIVAYLWSTPGVAPGFWDMFVLTPLENLFRPKFRKDDVSLGKKLGEGAFGTVYMASLANKQLLKKDGPLVVKKANEYGAVEAWMNERVRRACRRSCADFVSGFLDDTSPKGKEEFWLLWRFEGKATLADLMANRDFPYNVEDMILGSGKGDDMPRGPERQSRILRTIMKQILTALAQLHSTGIVHRDIKPQNIIFSDDTKTFKIIDLGAAADLRVGINYIPKEFLLDPRYAAPEQYIMSTQTPSAPPPIIAAALSPVLWQMNLPDRFDIYSLGLIFLQMAFPNLRNDSGLISFNRQLKRQEYNMVQWRNLVEAKENKDIRQGFEILDMDGGVGWELVKDMVRFKGRKRISANAALAHPYFDTAGILGLSFMQQLRLRLARGAQVENEGFDWVTSLMAKSGTKSVGGFTEAQLQDMREKEPKRKGSIQRNAMAQALRLQRKAARTIAATVDDIQTGEVAKRVNWWNRWQN
jgi:serine/threonine protein kinase